MPMTTHMAAAAPSGAMINMTQWRPLSVVISSSSAAVAILLLIGGIGLLKRHPRSPNTLRVFAVLKILVAILTAALTLSMMQSQFAAVHTQSGQQPPRALMNGIAILGTVFAVLWGAAYPVVLLVWFALPGIRRETATWSYPT